MRLSIDLPDDDVAALHERAEKRGVSAEAYVRTVLEQELRKYNKVRLSPKLRHISEVMAEIMAAAPPDPAK